MGSVCLLYGHIVGDDVGRLEDSKTMGTKITKVTPLEGVVAETAGAFTLYLTEILKIPVSTTHTITGLLSVWERPNAYLRFVGV